MSRTVLVCDDAMFMRTAIAHALASAGYTIVGEAANGREAVEQYKALRPDCVTLDMVMPELGGVDAAREICAFDADARILMCSAVGQDTLISDARKAGARAFLVKPFAPQALIDEVAGLLAAGTAA